jgi:hypothetical protein
MIPSSDTAASIGIVTLFWDLAEDGVGEPDSFGQGEGEGTAEADDGFEIDC